MSSDDDLTEYRVAKTIDSHPEQSEEVTIEKMHFFKDAWIDGTIEVGKNYFCKEKISAKEAAAVEFKRLSECSPNIEIVVDGLAKLPQEKQALLISMCSFFDASLGGLLAETYGVSSIADLSLRMDDRGRGICVRLFQNYQGWV